MSLTVRVPPNHEEDMSAFDVPVSALMTVVAPAESVVMNSTSTTTEPLLTVRTTTSSMPAPVFAPVVKCVSRYWRKHSQKMFHELKR